MRVSVNDNVDVKENLTNNKRWFNGMKKFSSVKVQPPTDDTPPPDLGVHVVEVIDTADIFGG